MGHHGRATALDDTTDAFFPAVTATPALDAFPSPASVTESLSSPGLHLELGTTVSQFSPSAGVEEAASSAGVVPSMPDEVKMEPVLSPPVQDAGPEINAFSGVLAPVPTSSLRSRSSSSNKSSHALRLPPFEQLGIAAPHPDRPGNASGPLASFGHAPVFEDQKPAGGRGDGRAVRSPIYHYVDTLTPPTETGPPMWDLQSAVETGGMHSPSADSGEAVGDSQDGGASVTEGVTTSATGALDAAEPSLEQLSVVEGPHAWIQGALDVLLENVREGMPPAGTLKILSHALPRTSATGHVFGTVVGHMHASRPASPIRPANCINVLHAIPVAIGRFNLADLPTTPPISPALAVDGDYFTQTFDSAVLVSDYQDNALATPRTPRPIVPPASIDVAIVERYIPPSTSHEFAEMFDPNGSSILVDRLIELSPHNGSLLFIYPTRRGGRTFMKDYLGPILDPLLRTMVVVHGLSTALCSSIGTMRAVDHLPHYDSLLHRMASLCDTLTTQQDTAARRFHGSRSTFSLSYAARHRVKLERGVWAREWWTKQEKNRIKQILDTHWRDNEARKSGFDHAGAAAVAAAHQATSSTVLLQHLLDGVVGRGEAEKDEPEGEGIEVGVFVIKRSL